VDAKELDAQSLPKKRLCWNARMPGIRMPGMLECWNAGMLECQNECWNARMNAGKPESTTLALFLHASFFIFFIFFNK